MVVSHERSGTHFLMNSIARAYVYRAAPWLDMDHDAMPINFFHPPSIADVLAGLADRRIATIVKSHHSADFFDGILDRVLKRYVVFYIHRDPVDVMLSFWRFMHRWRWHEGPKRPDPVAFARAEPEGQLMRYQRYQCRSMLDRWARHVEGWHRASAGRPRLRLVSYRALPDVIHEWRQPSHDFGSEPSLWRLYNAWTTVLGPLAKRSPQRFAAITMDIQRMLDEHHPSPSITSAAEPIVSNQPA